MALQINLLSDFFDKSLNRIFKDFKKNLSKIENLCDLKGLRFNSGHIPDYSIEIVQQLYLLRYAYAYITEYKYIFDRLFKLNFIEPKDAKVYSFGAGCGLEFYGLYFSLVEQGLKIKDTGFYQGIDLINWSYSDLLKLTPDIIINDVEFLDKIDPSYNIYMFPKSIGEFSVGEFDHVKDLLTNSISTQKKIVLISSFRESTPKDYIRFKQICKILDNKGYNSLDDRKEYWGFKKGTAVYSQNFTHFPDEIKNFITDLLNYCKLEKKQSCNSECSEVLNRCNPILTLAYVSYNVLRFEK